MASKYSLLLIGLCVVACQPQSDEFIPSPTAITATPIPTPTIPPMDDALAQLASEFQTLRRLPSRFSGGEGHGDVDQWQGRKHQVMLALGEQLGNGDYGRFQLTTLLGPADHIVTGGDPLFNLIQSLPEYESRSPSEEFLVYEWRSTHDFLFFAISNDQIIESGWWYAYE